MHSKHKIEYAQKIRGLYETNPTWDYLVHISIMEGYSVSQIYKLLKLAGVKFERKKKRDPKTGRIVKGYADEVKTDNEIKQSTGMEQS